MNIFRQIIQPNGTIGISYNIDENNKVYISKLRNNMPAKLAGLEVNDYIIKINDESMANRNQNYVLAKTKGKAGENVKILVKRDEVEKEFTIKRTKRKINWSI